jgi:hypothetical protein
LIRVLGKVIKPTIHYSDTEAFTPGVAYVYNCTIKCSLAQEQTCVGSTLTVLCELELVYWLQMYVTYVTVTVVIFGGGGGGGGEITDCKLNILGMTSSFCTLTMFVVNILQFFPHKLKECM